MVFSLGGSEILVLAFIALLLFGNKNLPQTMKKMVKGLNEVKKVASDAQRSWHEVRDDMTRQIMLEEAEEEAKSELAEIKKAIESPEKKPQVKPAQEGVVSRETDDLPSGHHDPSGGDATHSAVAETSAHAADDAEPYYENPEDDPSFHDNHPELTQTSSANADSDGSEKASEESKS